MRWRGWGEHKQESAEIFCFGFRQGTLDGEKMLGIRCNRRDSFLVILTFPRNNPPRPVTPRERVCELNNVKYNESGGSTRDWGVCNVQGRTRPR